MVPRSLYRSSSAITIPVAILAGTMLFGCSTQPESEPDAPRTEYVSLDPSVSYVGIDACVECHPVQAATYVESQMGRSFKPATRSLSDADWDNTYPIYDPTVDFYYLPFAAGDSLYLMEYRLAGRDTVHKRIEKIDYIVGSGQHTNSHMMEVNGYVYQIPITYYTQEGRWDLPPGFDEGHNWRFERAIEVECMTCHNGMPDYVVGSDNRFDELPHGINCERCHGPGEIHVEEKKAGLIVDTNREIDYTIVNPGRLSRELQFDVCQRCHLQGVAVPRDGYSFTDFRPGMRLGDVIDVYFPRYTDSLSHFIMASHPDRLRMAACRAPSETVPGQMDPLACVSCHNPHVPIEAQDRSVYNTVCSGCHGGDSLSVGLPECSESLVAREEMDDDCSSCHMPVTGSIDIPHVRITDHNIRKPDPKNASDDTEKRFIRLASLTSTQPSHKMMGEGYLTYFEQFNTVPQFLDSAAANVARARLESNDKDLAEVLVRLWYLEERYDEIASFADREDLTGSPKAWTLYRIGEAYSNLGRHRDARTYYRLAVDLGPDHLWFRTKLASAYVALQDPQAALTILNEVLDDNPTFHQAYNNRGFAYLLAGNFPAAEADFNTALSFDPDAEQALANLASLYFNTGDPAKAKPIIERLIQLKPDNEQYVAFRQAVDEAM